MISTHFLDARNLLHFDLPNRGPSTPRALASIAHEPFFQWLEVIIARSRPRDGAYKEGGKRARFKPHRAPFPKEIASHFSGSTKKVGTYLMQIGSSTTLLWVIDLDDHDGTLGWDELCRRADAVTAQLVERGLCPARFRSSGGKGIHLWGYWDEEQDSYSARQLLKQCVLAAGLEVKAGVAEVFPAQDRIEQGACGTCVFWPIERLDEGEWQPSVPVPRLEPPERPTASARAGDTDLRLLRSAVMAIPNGGDGGDEQPYGEGEFGWLKVGMGLHAATGGGDEGRDLWHEWSEQSGSKYDPRDLERRWRSFKSGGRVTAGTIFFKAKEHGWDRQHAEAEIAFSGAARGGGQAEGDGGDGGDGDAPEAKVKDAELEWLLENAPAVLKAYIDWHLENALRPHPVFALVSGLLFIQSVVGRGVCLPRGLRPNLWMLLLAPTESGKGDVPRLATMALAQLQAANRVPAVSQFEEAFASAEGVWWHLESSPVAVWVDEELAKTLAAIIAAPEGTPRYAMKRTLLRLSDAATQEVVAPMRYSQRTKSANDMRPLHHPFLGITGTGVPRDIRSFSAAAADDGLLNRFLVVVVEDRPKVGTLREVSALPASIKEWAKKACAYDQHESIPEMSNGPKTLETYPAFDQDWASAMNDGSERAQALPGVWGRYAEKILKVATLYAVADSGAVAPEAFAWARRFVAWATADFARHFESEGGGAENEMDAMGKAFMAAFDAPAMKDKLMLPSREFARYGGRAWRSCRDSLKRKRVIEALIEDGLIEEILMPNGKGRKYRRL